MAATLAEGSVGASGRSQRYLLLKHALFNVYLSTLTLTSSPHQNSNGRLTRLHGITLKRGHRKLTAQRGAWLVGPL